MNRVVVVFLSLALFASCQPPEKVELLATTSVLADAARQILPESVMVTALMQSNIDPHSYKPVESDVAKLQNAKIILHNGLHLEGKMTDILEKMGQIKPVYAMSSTLRLPDLIETGVNSYDPTYLV